MTVPGNSVFNPAIHLGIDDITVDNCRQPAMLRVSIKASKTDPFRTGVEFFMGRVASSLCGGPRLLHCFSTEMVIISQGNASHVLSGRLCRRQTDIGAATTAASKGIEDTIMKALGWWEAWHTYSMCGSRGTVGYSDRSAW